jgi:peptidoglycan/xylan/chitin deacetylase (PgdA/CDA1 family)
VRARLHAAGTTLFLIAALSAALVSADPQVAVFSTPSTLPLVGTGDGSQPHQRDTHHVVFSAYIPAGRTDISVPILLYHYIRDLPPTADRLSYDLSVTVADFTAQMDWLAAHDYHPITMEALDAYFTKREPLPSRPLVITIDDGYRDLYTTAYPILRAHGFSAVAYIVSGFVGEPRYVTRAMIEEMEANGIEIASHTVDHPDLVHTSAPMVTYEVVYAKQWLERLIDLPVDDFAYPSGRFNDAVVEQVEKAGYESAVTELPGTYHSWADRFEWSRVRVSGGESLKTFIVNLGPVEPYLSAGKATS